MKLAKIIKSKFKDQSGVTAIIVAVSMVMLLGFVALAIDIGYLYTTKNELQNVADAAALAAAGKLGEIYSNPDPAFDPATYVCNEYDAALIRSAAHEVAGKNSAGGKYIEIKDGEDGDIYIYNLKAALYNTTYSANNYIQPDTVRVKARRDSILNLPINTFFARVFNVDVLSVTADATAALTGAAKIVEEGLPVPVGISKKRFESAYCDQPISFHPTGTIEACGGWHTYNDDKGKIKVEILPGLIDGTFTSPETVVGQDYSFDGGVIDPAFVLLKNLFDINKILDDGITDLDDDPYTWTTSVVVYNWDNCDNPNTDIEIIGFSAITIYEVCHATSKPCTVDNFPDPNDPDKVITVTVDDMSIIATIACGLVEPTRGGGGNFGTMGSIPGLIE